MVEFMLPMMGALVLTGAMLVVGLIAFLAVYIYMAFAWMTIATKLKYGKGWLAWIPVVQFALLPILAKRKESSWPWVFILLIPIVNIVFVFMWTWQIYVRRNYPGWLALIPLIGIIPLIGCLGGLANLIITGFVAWKNR